MSARLNAFDVMRANGARTEEQFLEPGDFNQGRTGTVAVATTLCAYLQQLGIRVAAAFKADWVRSVTNLCSLVFKIDQHWPKIYERASPLTKQSVALLERLKLLSPRAAVFNTPDEVAQRKARKNVKSDDLAEWAESLHSLLGPFLFHLRPLSELRQALVAVAEACDEYVLYLKGQVQRDAALDASVLPVVARHENNSVRFLPILNGPAPYALLSLWQRGGLLVVQAPDTADHCPAQPLVQRRQVRPSTLVAHPREGPSRPEPLLALGEVACVRPPTRTVCTTITGARAGAT